MWDTKEEKSQNNFDDLCKCDFKKIKRKNKLSPEAYGMCPHCTPINIIMKGKNGNMKVDLYEKSYHKGKFLNYLSKKLKLNVDVFQKDIFEEKNLSSGTLICRAFKPLPTILELVEKNFTDYANLIVFMGKSGNQILEESIKKWDLEYKKTESVTNKDSFLINFKKIKKK